MANKPELVDLGDIAKLLGVSPHTPNQWRQRSQNKTMHPPMPEPDFPDLKRPIWLKSTIIDWAKKCEPPRWPPGVASRPHTWGKRGPRRKAPEIPNAQIARGTNPSVPAAIFASAPEHPDN